MTFSVKANPTFEATVKIPSPTGEQTVQFVFRHKKRAELKDYLERVSKGEGDTAAKDLLEIVEGWTSSVTEPFSEQALGELIENYYGVLPAIFDAYVAGVTGSAAKN